jgi:hypothetical protein
MLTWIELALSLPATVYGIVNPETGKGELMCGDPGKVVPCDSNATTASGERFNPQELTVAVPLPFNRILRPVRLCLEHPKTGNKVWVKVNDKANERWIGQRGFDMTPATYEALTGKPARPWSSIERIKEC